MTKKQNDHFGLGPISERHRKHLMSLAPGTHSPLEHHGHPHADSHGDVWPLGRGRSPYA